MDDVQGALISTMVLASAADADMTDAELRTIGETVRQLPAFRGFDAARLPELARRCSEQLQAEDGLDRVLDGVVRDLPERLRETAYALACDVVASDGQATQEELRLLELLRDRLDLDRLHAAAIERGARARYAAP